MDSFYNWHMPIIKDLRIFNSILHRPLMPESSSLKVKPITIKPIKKT
jgi:hypothetical protein